MSYQPVVLISAEPEFLSAVPWARPGMRVAVVARDEAGSETIAIDGSGLLEPPAGSAGGMMIRITKPEGWEGAAEYTVLRAQRAKYTLELRNDRFVDVRELAAQIRLLTEAIQQAQHSLGSFDGIEGMATEAIRSLDGFALPPAGERYHSVLGFGEEGEPELHPKGPTGVQLLAAHDPVTARDIIEAYSMEQVDAAVDQVEYDINQSLVGMVEATVGNELPGLLFGGGKSLLSDMDWEVRDDEEWTFDQEESGTTYLWSYSGAEPVGAVKLPYSSERAASVLVINRTTSKRLKIEDDEGQLLPTAGEERRFVPPGGTVMLSHLEGGDWIVVGEVEEE